MTSFDYDLFVIGGGSGGVRAARMAAGYGARVAIAEEYRYGGTCVIRGCVPKKLLVYASEFHHHFQDARHYGWGVEEIDFQWSKLIANKDREIDRLNGIYERLLNQSSVEILNGRAVVTGAQSVRINDQTITAKRILLAVGATPRLPTFEGAEHIITSNEAFHLEKLPQRIVVVGGGYIAVEFAGIFNGLQVETHMVYRGEKILKGFDEDVRTAVTEGMENAGVQILTHTDITHIAKRDNSLGVTLKSGQVLDTDAVMYAIGRVPYTQDLGLESAEVKLSADKAVIVDEYARTNIPSIFAVGDVTNRMPLTPVAIREGQAFADREFNNSIETVDYNAVPTGVFSQPQVGTVGLTEENAITAHHDIDVYFTSFRPLKDTLTGQNNKIMIKVIVAVEDGRVVGVHLVGEGSAELIQVMAIAVKMGAKKSDLDQTVAVHPTIAEELVLMKTPQRRYRNKKLYPE